MPGMQGVAFDHVAIAVERHADAWPRLVGRLGGQWRSGGRAVGFAPAQIAYRDGVRVELLEPNVPERNDFLRRFLDRNGAGPHHLTFKVPSLDDAVAAVEGVGLSVVGEDRSDPGWMEAFVHPKQGPGIVVQLAQSEPGEWESPVPDDFPDSAPPPAGLEWTALAVRSLDDATALFVECLDGEVVAEGVSDLDAARWTELAWTGPSRLRLLTPIGEGPLEEWIGHRTGRLHHLRFCLPDPSTEPDAVEVSAGQWEVAPEVACGVRLRMVADG